jgi:hypothetical protein
LAANKLHHQRWIVVRKLSVTSIPRVAFGGAFKVQVHNHKPYFGLISKMIDTLYALPRCDEKDLKQHIRTVLFSLKDLPWKSLENYRLPPELPIQALKQILADMALSDEDSNCIKLGIALLGWCPSSLIVGSNVEQRALTCEMCMRNVPLWKPAAVFDALKEHRPYCAFILPSISDDRPGYLRWLDDLLPK